GGAVDRSLVVFGPLPRGVDGFVLEQQECGVALFGDHLVVVAALQLPCCPVVDEIRGEAQVLNSEDHVLTISPCASRGGPMECNPGHRSEMAQMASISSEQHARASRVGIRAERMVRESTQEAA